jgi:predicted transcriptional regulator YheO
MTRTARAARAAPVPAAAAPRRRAKAVTLPPAVATERRQLLSALHPIVQMLGTVVGPHVEVVLHDLTRPERSIVALANGHVSNRRVGQSLLSGPKDDAGFAAAKRALTVVGTALHSVVGPYPTVTAAGRRLKSSTVIFRDAAGDPYAALCVNADLTAFQAAHAFLQQLLQPSPAESPPDADTPEMDTLMQDIIADAVRRHGKPVDLLNKEEKVQAVQAMLQRGLFMVKGGVEKAAAALQVSRFTIYNYLEALRARNADGPSRR